MCVYACLFLWQARALTIDAQTAVGVAQQRLIDLKPVMDNADKATVNLAQASVTFNSAAGAETAKLQASTEELRKTEYATRRAIDSLRQIFIDVHLESLPKLNKALDDADQGEVQAVQRFTELVAHAQPLLDAATADLADPRLKEMIANLDQATAQLAADLAELKKMLESGSATAADIQRVADKVADEYTKTRNLAYAIFKELLSVGSEGVQFFLKK